MPPRSTTTGGVLEAMILPALKRGGYAYLTQQQIGERFGGGKHFVDVVAEKGSLRYLVSLKWQQVSGTAKQKVPFEVICLAQAVREGAFLKAYLVLGGEGWKLRTFYIGGGLKEYLAHADKVDILTLENFVAKANQGRL
ncbi:MAG TPA: PD-(D/E)XK nuclease superfamily protein [Candidatus Binataceae bacterium]|nr:PD-(D/E)XK nuclease superfamily protein [Candidatus Binataceae bacterium]